MPVIIVEKNVLYGIVDSFLLDNIKNIINGKWIGNSDLKFFLIPFSSLGNKNGMLVGFKPDYIKVHNDEEIIEKKGVIGIYEESLGGNLEYKAIIGL